MKAILSLVCVLAMTPPSLRAETAADAWITATQEDGFVLFESFATLAPGASGRYDVTATKQGTGGRSVSRQAGRIPASAKSEPLSVSRMSVEKGAVLTVELEVTSDNGEVYQDSVSVVGNPESP